MKKPRSLCVHSGLFHADELVAAALLVYFDKVDRNRIVRSRTEQAIAASEYVCDVGGVYLPEEKRFDHHQSDFLGDLSSAGMVLHFLKSEESSHAEFCDYLYSTFIYGVDRIDTGLDSPIPGYTDFSSLISTYVPPDHSTCDEEMDACFHEALTFVLGFIERLKRKFEYVKSCRREVWDVMEQSDELLLFDRSLSWQDAFFNWGKEHPGKLIVMPAAGGKWKLRAIPPTKEDPMNQRLSLPKKWAGLMGEELSKVCGIEGAIFAHKGQFIAIFDSKEGALKAAEMTLRGDDATD